MSDDKDKSHRAPDVTATGLGTGRNKIARTIEPRPVPRPDIADDDQLFDLAVDLMDAGRRRLMQVTLAEWQGLARFTVRTAVIASQACELARLHAAGAPKCDLELQLTKLLEVAGQQ